MVNGWWILNHVQFQFTPSWWKKCLWSQLPCARKGSRVLSVRSSVAPAALHGVTAVVFFWHPRRKSVGWFRYERVWIYTFNVNPGLINHGLLIRGTPPIVIIWYLNGTPPIKQPRGLLIQGWHYICFLGIFWSSSWYHSEKQPESWSKWLRKCNDLASRQGLLVGSWTWPNEGSALASRVGTSWVGTVQSSWHVLSSSWNLLDDGNHFLAPSSQNITAIGP